MKKFVAFGLVAAMGVSVAFASSLGVPWFVDNAAANTGIPPTSGTTTLIFLHNNTAAPMDCEITYFSEVGDVYIPSPNTFVIPALSSVAFRPVANDPASTVPGGGTFGQESSVGNAVPDRPQPDGKKNGACSISWVGGPNDIQGQLTAIQTIPSGNTRLNNTVPLVMSTSHLLPPGS